MEYLIYAIIINSLLALGFLVFNIFTGRKNVLVKTLIMFLCPVVGPLFFLMSHIFQYIIFSRPVDLADVIFSKERVKTFVRADESNETNMVPLEEAIEITGEKELRGLMMNVVKGDVQKLLSVISLALNSADSETSHYAASVLQEELSKFRDNVRKSADHIKENGVEEIAQVEMFIDYMNQILAQKVFNSLEQKNYVDTMDDICEIYYEEDAAEMSASVMEAVALRLIEVAEYDEALKWAERMKFFYPDELATYTVQLKLFFNNGQKERFFEVVRRLKASPIVIDNETLELLRVFNN